MDDYGRAILCSDLSRMKNFLLGLIVAIMSVTVTCTDSEHSCVDRNGINCTAVEQEYYTERSHCQEIFSKCMVKDPTCRVQEFCSDECRDIYHKVLLCNNNTRQQQLQYLNLYCAISNDPKYQNSSCIYLHLTLNSQGTTYGYDTSCQLEVRSEFAVPCMPICKEKLLKYKNDCCSINLAIARAIQPGGDNEDLISIYDHRLWDHCDVESPEMCPAPSCPNLAMNTPTPLEEGTGAASAYHVNWFLFVTVVTLLLYIM